MPDQQELRPICFMVMPFGEKKVRGPTGSNAPTQLNCDALFDKVYRPAIEQAGYTPIRADADKGSVIVKDMLERLAFADLVIADVSLPNGNVYYEIGLRHVAKETGCILFAAKWSRQLFDIDQFTAVRYELADGTVPDGMADAIRPSITGAIENLKGSRTPWHEFIAGSPEELAKRGVFRDFAQRLSRFQADVRAARLTRDKAARKTQVEALRDGLDKPTLEIAEVAIEVLHLIRDALGWQATLDFADKLPAGIASIPAVEEQRLLALANTGQPEAAIANLEELIERHGETPERRGLIGGRYKRLWRTARSKRTEAGDGESSADELSYLEDALENYTRGMELDYNEFYCSSNIAQLLVARGEPGDEQRAEIVDHFVVAACERAISRGEDDDWTRPTLLGAAFRAKDVAKAKELAKRVRKEGAAAWKLDSTLADLKDAVARAENGESGPQLGGIVGELERLLAP